LVRINKNESIDINSLKPYPHNVKEHPKKQIDDLKTMMSDGKIGYTYPILIDENNTILAGHGRVQAMKELGESSIPAIRLEGLTTSQKNQLVIRDNFVGDTDYNKQNLEILFKEIDPIDLEPFQMNIGEEFKIKPDIIEETGEVPEPPEEPKAKLGEIYQLGRHRIMCGRCTNSDYKKALFGDIVPNIILTDPPYSSGGFQEAGKGVGSVGTTAKPKAIHSDNLSTRGHVALISSAIDEIKADTLFIFTDWRMWITTFDIAESCGFPIRNMIVWDKKYLGMGFPWRTQHELILFAKRSPSKFIPENHLGNVIQADRTGNKNHPTEKPVDLLVKILSNAEGDTIYDPFAGSGSTLMACEELGKTFYGMEIEPGYIDVIIQRWENYTGEKAIKVTK